MSALSLHEFHHGISLTTHFAEVSGCEVVHDYGDWLAEHAALRNAVGVLDLSFRSRLCLVGADRLRWLNGQVTNNVKDLQPGQGCYAALVTAKGKLQSDLNIICLPNELLLDFEPGLTATIQERLEKYIIADDVQIVDASSPYGLLSVQGPEATTVMARMQLPMALPTKPLENILFADATLGEIYIVYNARLGTVGYDWFVPTASLGAVMDKLMTAAKASGGRACGWQAFEAARIEAGIPRFGLDMNESNLAPEPGIESRAISYAKGCYIGQEVIARIRTYGQVAKSLRGLRLAADLKSLPQSGDKLFHDGKEVGYVTSALASPAFQANIALGYVRKEITEPGTKLAVKSASGESIAELIPLPFKI